MSAAICGMDHPPDVAALIRATLASRSRHCGFALQSDLLSISIPTIEDDQVMDTKQPAPKNHYATYISEDTGDGPPDLRGS